MHSSEWYDLPQPARGIAEATVAAVTAARDTDADGYQVATTRLAGHHAEQVGIVAGETVRLLLEERYPDGLTGDDLRAVLTDCAGAARWYPEFDPTVAMTLIAGALGVHEADGEPLPLAAAEVAGHGPLLIARLATGAPHPLAVYLRAALAEIARTETMD
ncbi:hypothetical protein AB0I55_19400 [Actinocatenispora sera]|uniref:hypothetical protein n=1 Tax=Actinocatenispora sera TaxID=390989 RepID=UPI0033C9D8B9